MEIPACFHENHGIHGFWAVQMTPWQCFCLLNNLGGCSVRKAFDGIVSLCIIVQMGLVGSSRNAVSGF